MKSFKSPARWLALAAALFCLDASLTFRNVWPTPAISWKGDLSIELAVCLLGLAIASRWRAPLPQRALAAIAALWTILVVGHYADVTAPALYGREVNLYWDMQHMSGVAAMLATAASSWLVLLFVLAAALTVFAIYKVVRWAIGRVADATADGRARPAVGVLAAAVVLLFAAQPPASRMRDDFGADVVKDHRQFFSTPVTGTFVRQAQLVMQARAAARDSSSLAPSPPMNSDLSLVNGADVVLLFLESYGAVSYEQPRFAASLAGPRGRLEAAIRDTNRGVVSAFVDSPTFGGGSWLAHISLLAGIEVTDPDTNARLMAAKRDTLVRMFGRRGYRTVAIMPGLWHRWPEGDFYGFDTIYGGVRLDYRGPQFGWWDIPDQWTLAKMDALELDPSPRAPAFVVFPTINTHAPFSPIPPYQPDWARLLSGRPYDSPDLDEAFAEPPDWLDLGPSYETSLAYVLDSLGGYLRLHASRDFILIVIGDHQPPAAVTGEGASWSVPAHVIASRANRQPVLDRLTAYGFRSGLTPVRPAVTRMSALSQILVDAFGNREPAD